MKSNRAHFAHFNLSSYLLIWTVQFTFFFHTSNKMLCICVGCSCLFFTLFYWYVRLLWNPASFAAMVQKQHKFRFLSLSHSLCRAQLYSWKSICSMRIGSFFFVLNQTKTIRTALHCLVMKFASCDDVPVTKAMNMWNRIANN